MTVSFKKAILPPQVLSYFVVQHITGYHPQTGMMNETETIEALRLGKVNAFDDLIDTYKDMVVNTCFGFLHDREDAEDVAQDVFIEVFESIHHFRETAKISTWIYRIAVNKSLNLVKKKKRRQMVASLQAMFNPARETSDLTDADAADPQMALEQEERIRALRRAIASLAENQRIALTLSKYENLSYREIAEVMDTTVSAVESLLNRARKSLQKKLYDYYESEA